jgi:hypothetical protein
MELDSANSQIVCHLDNLRTLVQISDQDGGHPGIKGTDDSLCFGLGQISSPIGWAQGKSQMGDGGAAQQWRFLLVADSCNLNDRTHNDGDILRADEG